MWKPALVLLMTFTGLCRAQQNSDLVSVPDATFEFKSGFWCNLHHFLIEQAVQTPASRSGPAEWDAAVDYYRAKVVSLDPLSEESAQINLRLSDQKSSASLDGTGLSVALVNALNSVADFYRKRWWPAQDQANRAWVAQLSPRLEKYGGVLRQRLAVAYATPWPPDPIHVHVVEYANSTGAYTTLDPTHTTVSSTSDANQGDSGLEIVFHEASHALISKIRTALSDEVRARNRLLVHRDFWHAILFYTTGETVHQCLDGYTPYAVRHSLYERSWPGVPEILEGIWKPYMDGKVDLETAIRRLVDAYSLPK
jgi:hypothetical protein